MKSLLLQNRQFLLYCVIGASGAGLDTGIYSLLIKFKLLDVLAANLVGCCCGIIVSFVLNARYNFRVTDRIGQRLTRFFGVGLLGLLLSTAMLYLMVDQCHFNKYLSKIATLPAVVLLQYNLNRWFSFHKTR